MTDIALTIATLSLTGSALLGTTTWLRVFNLTLSVILLLYLTRKPKGNFPQCPRSKSRSG
jgi:hypothetical protein